MSMRVAAGIGASECAQTPPNTLPRFEDYLDSQITGTDMYYLENIELARHLVELG